MKRGGKAGAIMLATGLSLAGIGINCTSPWIPNEQRIVLDERVQRSAYVGLFEGLQPFSGYRMKELGEKLERDLGVSAVATSGNMQAHVEYARKAKANRQKVILAGFSMGENDARNAAELFNREGIEVDLLILIDGTETGMISENVRRIIDIKGTEFYGFRRQDLYSERHLRSRRTRIENYIVESSHMNITERAGDYVEAEILKILRN